MELMKEIRNISNNLDPNNKNEEFLSEINVKLKESENRLRELSERKDKFFSIISHDLRNPFHALIGMSDLLVNNIDDLSKDELKTIGEGINKSAKNLLNLVDNLLEWSRIQSDKINIKPSTFKLYPFVNKIISVLEGNAINKKIQIENIIDNNIKVTADKVMLTSIIQNLLSNAIKFTGEGGYIIISQKSNDKIIEISIKDTGTGMDSETLRKLFILGEKNSKPGTADEKGSGLGLILCRELVEKNGGKIYVDSKLNRGTTISFSLPIVNL